MPSSSSSSCSIETIRLNNTSERLGTKSADATMIRDINRQGRSVARMSTVSNKQATAIGCRQSTRTNYHHRKSPRTHASASIVSLTIIAVVALVAQDLGFASAAQNSTSKTSTTTNSTAGSNSTTSPAGQVRRTKSVPLNSASTKSASKSTPSSFDQQSSELSSMYVQIPIAEPVESPASSSDANQQQQQQQTTEDGADSSADSTKATTWTGPWPKKFQIGYIKQSDLHQVLIESLKNDPFLGSKKSTGSGAGSTSSGASKTTSPAAPPPTSAPSSLATKGGSSQSQMTTQEPSAATKSLSDSLAQLPAAPPSDASSLMQPASAYPNLKAVQQVSMATAGRLQHQHQPAVQQQYVQTQWPAGNSYGRLASPQVQPRPNSMGVYLSKGTVYQPMMQHHQQHHQQHQHQPINNQHSSGLNGHHQRHNGNNFRHQPNQGRQARHHHQAAFGAGPSAVGGHQHHMQGFKFGPAPLTHQMQPAAQFQQQHQANLAPNSMHLQQPHQVQFAGNPSFSSQPIYSINNFPTSQQQQQQTLQQQPVDSDQMELIQLTNGPSGNRQKSKSDYYLSSWRPVQTGDEAKSQVQQQQQVPSNEFGAADGFDDDFGGASSSGGSGSPQNSMNRHPVLSNFLQSNGGTSDQAQSAKASPAKMLKQQQQSSRSLGQVATKGGSGQAQPATKGMAAKGFDTDSVQQRQEGTKSDTGRRALAGDNSTTTTSTTPASSVATDNSTTMAGPTTTVASSMNGFESSTSSPITSTTTSATTMTTLANNQTANPMQGAETTTEPDSEVFESETTEPSTEQDESTSTTTSAPTPTTTGSSSMQAAGSRSTSPTPSLKSPSSSTQSSVQQQQSSDNGESEVVTQSQQSAGGNFGAVPQSNDESSSTQSSGQSTTTTNSNREETTPSSLSLANEMTSGGMSSTGGSTEVEGSSTAGFSSTPATSSDSSGKTDASMSDEALMAAAVRASDVTKSRVASQQQQKQKQKTSGQSQTSGTKKARSSERIVQSGQPAPSPARKSQQQQQQQPQSNKLITRKPNLGQRAGKQISGSVKGAAPQAGKTSQTTTNNKSGAQKSASLVSGSSATSKKKASGKAAKLTSAPKSNKFTRMVPGASGQLNQSSQMVSMTAAQAQSAAQTLASLLLSRCLSSSNCSHLLDVCSTKQAAVPFANNNNGTNSSSVSSTTPQTTTTPTGTDLTTASINATIAAAWSTPVGLMSSNLMGLMQALQADKALQLFPAWRDAIETIMDQEAPTGYTLIMPSNEAIDRMALAQVDSLLANSDQMSQLIDNHILDSSETIELGLSGRSSSSSTQTNLAALRQRHQTRYIKSKGLQINQHRDRMVTINGKRVVYANQQAPGGRIHVIDGLLDWPGQAFGQSGLSASTTTSATSNRLLDIMDTLKQCDKFDGFVTLAEGTGLTQILKQDEPLTVFVPSNEALRKIPDDELEVIKNNSTALREFIMYHIVNGSYFSQDLRDGQQLASILDMRPIQVGVRVDGCSRRLVEANTSPMRRPDIVAKNGVIHILDWYLTTRDNEWCDPIGRSVASGSNQRDSLASGSERVQQLASAEQSSLVSPASLPDNSNPQPSPTNLMNMNGGYATRMTGLPANHKPAPADMDTAATGASSNLIRPTKLTSLASQEQQQTPNSVHVSALPMSSVSVEPIQ